MWICCQQNMVIENGIKWSSNGHLAGFNFDGNLMMIDGNLEFAESMICYFPNGKSFTWGVYRKLFIFLFVFLRRIQENDEIQVQSMEDSGDIVTDCG
jgi:hypothetical protein